MTKVKICGITNLGDALAAMEAGADFLGFIFYEPSPRYVDPQTVKDIVSSVKSQRLENLLREVRNTKHVNFVGVFVNSPLTGVTQILDYCGLDAAQLHGDESPEYVNQFRGRAYKALRPQSLEEAEALIQRYQPTSLGSQPTVKQIDHLPHFLIDAYHPDLYGGTGHVTDWTMTARLAQRHSIMLAGSLTPANVAEAIRAVKPWGVDVSSGVEREKGKKDNDKVREFIRTAKGVSRDA